ncbi:MAG TPA: response regulator transcription factor [Pyrinomonadaceae bacterium]|jgi:DNA-binding NarL/FixJ family response regulator
MNTAQNPIRILLVDDHKSFSDCLAMLIDTHKPVMKVVGEASNRREALTFAAQKRPDVVLLDIELGNDNGLDILPELLERATAKIIILTGTQTPEVHETAILRGAHGVLLKTDPAQVILKAIEKVHAGEVWISSQTLSRVLGQMTRQRSGRRNEETDPEKQKIAALTAREREIIRALVGGESSTNKEIADRLCISDSTLKNHLTTIYSKLEVKNRIDLLKYALHHKLDKTPSG